MVLAGASGVTPGAGQSSGSHRAGTTTASGPWSWLPCRVSVYAEFRLVGNLWPDWLHTPSGLLCPGRFIA